MNQNRFSLHASLAQLTAVRDIDLRARFSLYTLHSDCLAL